MKRTAAILAVPALCLPFAGCAEFQQATAVLSSPQTTQAANNVGQFVKAFACGVSAAAASAEGVEAQTYNGAPLVDAKGQTITAIVYASSAAACTLLNGVLTSTTTVSVPANSVVTPTVAKALRRKLRLASDGGTVI